MSRNIELKEVVVESRDKEVQDLIKLNIFLKNIGTSAAKKAKGTLRSADPSIVVTDDAGTYRTLDPEEEYSGAFAIDAGAAAIGRHLLNLDVSYEIAGVVATEKLEIPIDIIASRATGETEKVILDGLDTVLASEEGAVHTKVDLHVHTPASACCKFDGRSDAFVDAMWKRCKEADVRLIALTDHNSPGYTGDIHSPTYYELFQKKREEERRKGRDDFDLEVLPGTELTANGIHILAIFPPNRYATFTIAALLDDLSVKPEEWGGRNTVCTESATRVLDEVTRRGGIAIPAHVDTSNGLLDKHPKGQELIRVIEHKALHGVEYVNGPHPSMIVSKVAAHRKDRPLAYLRGSDNHMSPAGKKDLGKAIGERHTWVKMGNPGFAGLKKALQDPGSALRTSTDNISKGGFTKLLGMTVRGGFANGTSLRFNSDMNCFIGRLGSGKSTRLKLIGKAMDPDLDWELRDEEVLLFFEKANVPTSEHYYCFWASSAFSGTRFFKVHKTKRTVVEVQDEEVFGLALPKIYDQDYIDKVVTSPSKLLDFISRHYFQEPKTLMDTAFVEKECKGLTKGGRTKATTRLDRLKEALARYVADKEGTLKDSKLDSEIQKELQRLMKAGLLDNESVHTPGQLADLGSLVGQIDLIKKDERKVKSALKAYIDYKHQQKQSSLTAFSDVVRDEGDPRKVARALKDLLDQGDIKSTTLKKDLAAHCGDATLASELKRFTDDAMLANKREVRRDYLTEQAQIVLARAYGEAIGARQDARNRLRDLLEAPQGTSETDPTELRDAYDRVHGLRTVLAELFKTNFMNEKGQAILTLRIDRGSWKTSMKGGMEPAQLQDLITEGRKAIDDIPEIKLRGDVGLRRLTEEFKDERTVATMLILLNNREFGPFVVDEPEQHLDNESVFRHLVPRLRQLKDRQQLLMVTRNPNIPLSGDSENIIVSRAESKDLSYIVANGSLDLESINDVGATILEGGYDAFSSRRQKYELFKHGTR